MFAYITGKLACIYEDNLVVDVSGIGYRLTVPKHILCSTSIGDTVKLHTYMYVREDNIGIYGFGNQEELKLFELLISVSGIGPKVAISIVSEIPPAQFVSAIISNDAIALTRVQGIGTKTAQRLILELRDKIKKMHYIPDNMLARQEIMTDQKSEEAIDALMILGYSETEARRAIKAESSFGNGEDIAIEEIIKQALKHLTKDAVKNRK